MIVMKSTQIDPCMALNLPNFPAEPANLLVLTMRLLLA